MDPYPSERRADDDGFTIVQFFERLSGFENVEPAARSMAPRYVGLVLIGAGIAVLLISAFQYRSFLRYMWSEEYAPIRGWGSAPRLTPLYAVTIGMILVGVFAFLVVVFRAI
jgi:putative membrane protein